MHCWDTAGGAEPPGMLLRFSLWERQKVRILRLVPVRLGFFEETGNPWSTGEGSSASVLYIVSERRV